MDKAKFIKSRLPSLSKYINENNITYKSNLNSREGLIVPEIVLKYGEFKIDSGHFKILPKVFKTIWESKKSYKSTIKNLNLNKTFISKDILSEFKSLAYSLGISDIGFAEIDNSMIFKNKEILFNKAIVFTMEMEKEIITLAPSKETGEEIFRTYLDLGKVVNILSSFLRNNGFKVQGSPALGGDVIYPILAEKAGLGATGKHGLLIGPNQGPSLRIASIFTEIENLPLNTSNNHLWIKEFCEKCNRCIRVCPSSAILKNSFTYSDGAKRCIDYKKCVIPFSKNYGCTVCVKECTFFKTNYYKIKENFHESIWYR